MTLPQSMYFVSPSNAWSMLECHTGVSPIFDMILARRESTIALALLRKEMTPNPSCLVVDSQPAADRYAREYREAVAVADAEMAEAGIEHEHSFQYLVPARHIMPYGANVCG